jgi:hypothetical protein
MTRVVACDGAHAVTFGPDLAFSLPIASVRMSLSKFLMAVAVTLSFLASGLINCSSSRSERPFSTASAKMARAPASSGGPSAAIFSMSVAAAPSPV